MVTVLTCDYLCLLVVLTVLQQFHGKEKKLVRMSLLQNHLCSWALNVLGNMDYDVC